MEFFKSLGVSPWILIISLAVGYFSYLRVFNGYNDIDKDKYYKALIFAIIPIILYYHIKLCLLLIKALLIPYISFHVSFLPKADYIYSFFINFISILVSFYILYYVVHMLTKNNNHLLNTLIYKNFDGRKNIFMTLAQNKSFNTLSLTVILKDGQIFKSKNIVQYEAAPISNIIIDEDGNIGMYVDQITDTNLIPPNITNLTVFDVDYNQGIYTLISHSEIKYYKFKIEN